MTPLQDAFDAFILKVDENLSGKEEMILNYLKSAISKCYKTVRHSLEYVLTNEFEGYFIDTLDQDEIEFISLNMLYEHKRRRKEYLEASKTLLGTKDFSNLPDKSRELTTLSQSMKDLREEISDLKHEFNTFSY